MSTEERSGARRTTATVVATAAVTLAIGVTAAALGGYLVPNRSVGTPDVGGAATPATVETVATSQPAMPSVVLVPVAPDSQREAPAAFPRQVEAEVLLAAYEPDEHREDDDVEEHWRGDHHHPRHEDDHDDED